MSTCLNVCGTSEDENASDARPAPPEELRAPPPGDVLCGATVPEDWTGAACGLSARLCGTDATGGVDDAPTDDEEVDEALAAKPEAGSRFWNRKVAFWRRDASGSDRFTRSSSYLAAQSDWKPPPDVPEDVRKGSSFNVLAARDLQNTDEVILPPEDPHAGPAKRSAGA